MFCLKVMLQNPQRRTSVMIGWPFIRDGVKVYHYLFINFIKCPQFLNLSGSQNTVPIFANQKCKYLIIYPVTTFVFNSL